MNNKPLNAFTIKLIAIISMGLQHTLRVLWPYIPVNWLFPLFIFRGITFPIMAFFLVEGFKRTSNKTRYLMRLLAFASISQIPYMLVLGLPFFRLNIIFSFSLGLILLWLYEHFYLNGKEGQFGTLLIVILVASMFTEAMFIGPIVFFAIYIIKDEKKRIIFPLLGAGLFELALLLLSVPIYRDMQAEALEYLSLALQLEYMIVQQVGTVFSIGAFIAIPLLLLYNGERGPRAKYLFYVFYPGHWIILAIIPFFILR